MNNSSSIDCAICLERYYEMEHISKFLSCGRSVCLSCAQIFFEGLEVTTGAIISGMSTSSSDPIRHSSVESVGEVITCSTCGKLSISEYDSLPTDFTVLSIASSITNQMSSSQSIGSEYKPYQTTKRHVVVHCETCRQLLCNHHLGAEYDDHLLVPIASDSHMTMSTIYDKEFAFYSLNCKVCLFCCILDHNIYDCIGLSSVFAKVKSTTDSQLLSLYSVCTDMSMCISHATELGNDLFNKDMDIGQQIHKSYLTVVTALEHCSDELISSLPSKRLQVEAHKHSIQSLPTRVSDHAQQCKLGSSGMIRYLSSSEILLSTVRDEINFECDSEDVHQLHSPSTDKSRVHCNVEYATVVVCGNNSRQRRSEIQIFIRTLKDTTIAINVDLSSTIGDLKKAIWLRDGIPSRFQRALVGCLEYSNDSRLSQLFVADNSTMTLLLRLIGGNPEANHKIMPVTWWFGFGRSYQDGRTGEEGHICNVLTEFEFDGLNPVNWYTESPLSEWKGLKLLMSEEGAIQGMKRLTLLNSGLCAMPESIGSLTSLTELTAYNNQLTSLPECIGNFTSLTGLYVSHNQLTSFPESIGNLILLNVLSAYNNHLTSLPESIGSLGSLTQLFIQGNQLSSLPESIGNLRSLIGLYVNYNQLTSLPESVANMVSLRQLSCFDNPMSSTQEGKDELKKRFSRPQMTLAV